MLLLDYAWRRGGAALCFCAVAGGGVLASLLYFPLLRLLPGGRAARERRVRAFVHRGFGALLAALRFFSVMRVDPRNLHRLRDLGPVLVVANHPSYFDIVVLIANIPDAICVVKGGVWNSPAFRAVVRAAGYVPNNAPGELVRDCAASLSKGAPLIIFPEGTRSVPGAPLHFVRGAAHVALHTGAPIVPVVMRFDPPSLPHGTSWYQVPPVCTQVQVEVLPAIGAGALLERQRVADPTLRAGARSLTRALERFFTEVVRSHERPAT